MEEEVVVVAVEAAIAAMVAAVVAVVMMVMKTMTTRDQTRSANELSTADYQRPAKVLKATRQPDGLMGHGMEQITGDESTCHCHLLSRL